MEGFFMQGLFFINIPISSVSDPPSDSKTGGNTGCRNTSPLACANLFRQKNLHLREKNFLLTLLSHPDSNNPCEATAVREAIASHFRL
jgi:hypothetical protein